VEALRPGDPERIGGYLLQARLGAGGMGQVFFGRSPGGMPVALKVVHASLAGDGSFRARFRREVTAARAVSGAFTAPLIDADPEAPLPWLATAFLPGMSLQDAVATHGPFPAPAVFALGASLAEALTSIHRAGVVHRDLKPSNVMLGSDGPRVIDFGIAHAAEASVVTQAGHAIGSPGFLSPEQARGDATGPASDVFSFGAVLGHVATGEGPFGNAAVAVLLYRVVHEPPQLDRVADPELRDLIAACLDKIPERRPALGDLLQRLAYRTPRTDVLQGTAWLPGPVAADITRRATQTAPPGSTPYDPVPTRIHRRRFLVLGLSGSAVVLTVGGGVAAAVAAAGGGSGGRTATTSSPRPASASPSPPPPTRAGKVRWKHGTGGYLRSNPTVRDGTVYVGGAKGNLLALDSGTGRPRWRQRVASPGVDVVAAPAVVGGVVYMSSLGGDLYALDARTGRVRWRHNAGEQIASAAVAAGGTVYVASQIGNIAGGFKGGYLTALNATTGAVKWRRRTKEAINSELAVADGVIYVPDDSLYALDAATGRVRWTYKNSDIQSPALGGGVVYCGNFQGEELHAVDAATGKRRWKYPTGGPVTARPLVAGGRVYVGNWDGNMYALDAATGTMRWQLQTSGQIQSDAAMAGGLVCFGSGVSSAGDVYAADAATGRAVWRHHTDKGVESSPAIAGGTVYISCQDGFVYALDIKGGTETVPPTAD
jgi:outer membrane protein assembly factor BamB